MPSPMALVEGIPKEKMSSSSSPSRALVVIDPRHLENKRHLNHVLQTRNAIEIMESKGSGGLGWSEKEGLNWFLGINVFGTDQRQVVSVWNESRAWE